MKKHDIADAFIVDLNIKASGKIKYGITIYERVEFTVTYPEILL